MKPSVELYINGQLIEFEQAPAILMTYSNSELTNPTVVKNSFSKTLEIEGTPNNNKVFNCFYDLKWTNGAGFNPSQKMPFELYNNGEIIETGYIKLDNVRRNGKTIKYNVTLYGGLGQFLYNLTTKEDGEEMKLKDLIYPYDLNFEVNKDTVWNAWMHINNIDSPIMPLSDELNVYDFINFAPCYNGIPKDFTANKVAINAEMFPDDYKATLDLSIDEYTTVNGWIMGELQDNLDEWKTKDLRSYLQRPVIRVKEIIKACCDPQNNGGYEVELDNDFFNADNKYWNDAWMTLPLLTEMEEIASDNEVTFATDADGKVLVSGLSYGDRFKATLNYYVTSDANVPLQSNGYGYDLYTGAYTFDRNTPLISANMAIYSQLVAYNSDGVAVGGSPVMSLTRKYGKIPTDFTYDLEYDAPVQVVNGHFYYMGDIANYRYRFFDDLAFGQYTGGTLPSQHLTIENVKWTDGMYLKFVTKIATIDNGTILGQAGKLFWTEGYDAFSTEPLLSESWSDLEGAQTAIGWRITQNTLLNSDHTPCDYFLSYLKLFNLHIWKDMYMNKIYIKQRQNFYLDEYVDIEDVVDRGDEMNVTPLTFDAKWYNFKLDMETSGALYKDYKNEYGIEYGIQKVDTNYNFDNSSKNLFEKNAYKGCIMQRGKSRYYIDFFDERYGRTPLPAYIQDGIQTFLYNSSGDTTEGTYITPKTSLDTSAWGYGKNYDITPKPSFVDVKNEPIEGANCLLFYDGYKELKDENGNYLHYNLTDDIVEFEILNEGEPCWIWTSAPWNIEGDKIALNVSNLPIFSRYSTNDNSWVIHSLDFGTPKALYVEDYQIDETSSIYAQYWQSYIRDQYNVNTRIVECKVYIKDKAAADWLRRFYYFDGTYWALQQITDYDSASNNTTKCKFVRINNPDNYLL